MIRVKSEGVEDAIVLRQRFGLVLADRCFPSKGTWALSSPRPLAATSVASMMGFLLDLNSCHSLETSAGAQHSYRPLTLLSKGTARTGRQAGYKVSDNLQALLRAPNPAPPAACPHGWTAQASHPASAGESHRRIPAWSRRRPGCGFRPSAAPAACTAGHTSPPLQ